MDATGEALRAALPAWADAHGVPAPEAVDFHSIAERAAELGVPTAAPPDPCPAVSAGPGAAEEGVRVADRALERFAVHPQDRRRASAEGTEDEDGAKGDKCRDPER